MFLTFNCSAVFIISSTACFTACFGDFSSTFSTAVKAVNASSNRSFFFEVSSGVFIALSGFLLLCLLLHIR